MRAITPINPNDILSDEEIDESDSYLMYQFKKKQQLLEKSLGESKEKLNVIRSAKAVRNAYSSMSQQNQGTNSLSLTTTNPMYNPPSLTQNNLFYKSY
jgi:hypothetical protein